MTKRWVQPRIRVSVQGTVRTQDPNPSKILEGSIRATPLYEIVVLILSHYICWVCPSPPTSASCQVRPFIFFGEMANHLGWGAPKHMPVIVYRYTLVSRRIVVLLSGSHRNGTSPPYPSIHAHTIQGIRVPGLLLRSYDFKRKWWCTMALPSATVHLLSFPPN